MILFSNRSKVSIWFWSSRRFCYRKYSSFVQQNHFLPQCLKLCRFSILLCHGPSLYKGSKDCLWHFFYIKCSQIVWFKTFIGFNATLITIPSWNYSKIGLKPVVTYNLYGSFKELLNCFLYRLRSLQEAASWSFVDRFLANIFISFGF